MSSFPTVQLEGPRLMKQPSVTSVYQEERTILPEPNIQISQGLDWDSVAKEAANLGIGIVQGMREDEWSLRASAIQKDQDDTERAIRAAVRVNDFAAVDSIKREYKKRTADFIGGDPDDDNFIGTNMAQRKLLTQTRGFNASIDSYLEEQQAGWQEEIEFDNYTTYSFNRDKQLTEDPSYLPKAIEDQVTLFKQYGGGDDMSKPIPTVGLTANQRKLLFGIQKDYLDLLEMQKKMEVPPRTMASTLKENRQTLSIVTDTLKRAADLVNRAKEIEERPNPSDDEMQEAAKLRQLALREQTLAYQTFERTANTLVDQAKTEIVAGIPEDFVGPPEIPQEFEKPISTEAMFTLMQIGGFEPEDATALKNAYDEVARLESTSPDFLTMRKLYNNQKTEIEKLVDSMIVDAKASISQIDNSLREQPEGYGRDLLLFQRKNIIEQLHKNLYFTAVHPFIPQSYKQSKSVEDFLGRSISRMSMSPVKAESPFMAFVGGDKKILLPLDDENSYSTAMLLSRKEFGTVGDIFLDTKKKFLGLVSAEANIPTEVGGSGRRRSGQLSQDDQNRIDAYLFASGQEPDRNVTDGDQRTFALLLAKDMAGIDNLGNLKSLSDILSGKAEVNSSIPFNRSLFVQTPWFSQMVDMIRTAGNEDERDRIISGVERIFKADEVGDTGYTTPPDTKRNVVKLFDEEIGHETLELVFLFSPSDTRAAVLEHIGKSDSKVSVGLQARLKALHERYKKDGQRSNPRSFIEVIGKDSRYEGGTQLLVNEVIKRMSSEEVKSGKYTGEREDLKIAAANRNFIDTVYIPNVIKKLGERFGLLPEDMSNIAIAQVFKQRFERDLIENAHLYINPKTGKIEMNLAQLVEVSVKAADEIKAQGYTYSKREASFTKENIDRSPAKEITLTGTFFENNAGFDPGREQRLPMFLSMEPKVPIFVSASDSFVGPPEDDSTVLNITASAYTNKKLTFEEQQDFKRIVNERPFESLIMLGMYRGRTSNVTASNVFDAITNTVDDMPKDNLTILSVTAASRLLGVDTLSDEYGKRLKELSIDIRRSIDSKDGRYSISVVAAPSNYSNTGTEPTIRVLDSSGKQLSSMQPKEHNWQSGNIIINKQDDKSLVKIITSTEDDKTRKDAAIKYFMENPNSGPIRFNERKPTLLGIPGTPVRDIIYTYRTSTGKVNLIKAEEHWNTAGLGIGSWEIYSPVVLATLKKPETHNLPSENILLDIQDSKPLVQTTVSKTKNDLWLENQPRGRTIKSFSDIVWTSPDTRNTALEPGNLSIGSATLFKDVAVDSDNPLYVEIRRYKGKFYVVRKDSKDTSQHFGVLNNIEDANKYVESMKRFLSK